MCHVWRNTRLIFHITDTGTFGELCAFTPWPLTISITAKQFEEKIYWFLVCRQVTLLTNESISMKIEMFTTNVIKVPGGTNSNSDGPKIYCLLNIIAGIDTRKHILIFPCEMGEEI